MILVRLHKNADTVQGCLLESLYATCNIQVFSISTIVKADTKSLVADCGFKFFGATNANYRKFRNLWSV